MRRGWIVAGVVVLAALPAVPVTAAGVSLVLERVSESDRDDMGKWMRTGDVQRFRAPLNGMAGEDRAVVRPVLHEANCAPSPVSTPGADVTPLISGYATRLPHGKATRKTVRAPAAVPRASARAPLPASTPTVSIPSAPKASAPSTPRISTPRVSTPRVSVPVPPSVPMPSVPMPSASVPVVATPSVSLPAVATPSVSASPEPPLAAPAPLPLEVVAVPRRAQAAEGSVNPLKGPLGHLLVAGAIAGLLGALWGIVTVQKHRKRRMVL